MNILNFFECGFEWTLPVNANVVDCASGCNQVQNLDEWFSAVAQTHLKAFIGKKDENGVYLIHANGCFTSDSTRQDLEGVEVLKHIRLSEDLAELRTWHAIVCSFEPLEDILRRKPGSLILTSPGVTFLRLPDSLDLEAAIRKVYEVKRVVPTLPQLAEKREHRAVLDRSFRRFVAADYSPPDSDHAISNWWGARQIIAGLNRFGGTADEEDLPAEVAVELSRLDNKKAMFLATRMSEPRRSDPGWRRDITREINRLRKCMGDLPHPPKIVYVDDEMDKGWDEAIYFAINDERLPKEGVPWFHTSVGQLAHPKNSKEDWQEIAEMVLDQDPDLILTDLRLLGNSEARTAVKETSGAGLVAILRERAPGVPILLLTASNKAWTMQEAFRLGVDAYWMKEGIGDHASPNGSIENTAELKGLLSHLLGADYQLLRKIQLRTDLFKGAWNGNEPPWWKEMQWEEPSPALDPLALVPPIVTKPDFKAVFSLLESLARSYREYLRLVILRYGSQDLRGSRFEETTNFWLQSLVVHVGRIIEAIHGFDDIRSNIDLPGQRSLATSGTIGGYPDRRSGCAQKMRRDWFGQSLYECRSIAAHYYPANPLITGKNIRSLLAALFAWLTTEPACLESPHSLRVSRDGSHLIWPRAEDLFRGPDKDAELVSEYVKLIGSPQLDLPRRRA